MGTGTSRPAQDIAQQSGQVPQDMPPQGFGAVQTALSKFLTEHPPHPSGVFGGQPPQNNAQQGYATIRDAYSNFMAQHGPNAQPGILGTPFGEAQPNPAVQAPQGMPPQPPMAIPPGIPGTFNPQQMPGAPMTQQVRPEDARMQAMRNLQRYRGFQ
jgi:hypothetical protein